MSKTVSAIMMFLLMLGTLALAFNVQQVRASGTIYIRADGSIDPPTAPVERSGDVYTLTDNITSDTWGIVIERNNTVLDGAGYTISGVGGYGINLASGSNVTIKNMSIRNFSYGIRLYSSSNSSISGNNVTDNNRNIDVNGGSYNRIVNNSLSGGGVGVGFWYSSDNTFIGNNLTNISEGILIAFSGSNNNTISTNILTNLGIGMNLQQNAANNTISWNTLGNISSGIQITNAAPNNTVSYNNLTNNYNEGIVVQSSANNSIFENNITDSQNAISVESCSGNIVSRNSVARSGYSGIGLGNSATDNTVSQNTVADGAGCGIQVSFSSNNNISENKVENNNVGVQVRLSSGNAFFSNNFVNNAEQVWTDSTSVWDDGYPIGGNYWSDYGGLDVKKGPAQDEPGSDGIGDTPYIINANNLDHYPLMYPYGSLLPPTHSLTIAVAAGGTTDPTPGTYTYFEGQAVPVKALRFIGYVFDHWELDSANVGSANPINVPMNESHSLNGFFIQKNFTLEVLTTDGGTTSPAPDVYSYPAGSLVQVAAIPNTGYLLDHWQLDEVNVGATNPFTLTIDADHSLRAVFTLGCTLNITTSVGGTTDPASGTYVFHQGTFVNVTALPDFGYYFDHWDLDGSNVGATNPTEIIMDVNHTLCAVFLAHDVAVTNVVSLKTVICQGFRGNLTVTVQNAGNFTEEINVTVFANATIIASGSATLPAGNSATFTFMWNTAGFAYGKYILSAYASPVPGETNTANNNFTGGWVIVSIVGDITGGTSNLLDFVPDGKVDMRDIGVVARFFGQNVPPAPSNCDITGPITGVPDGKIDMRDIGLVARHFGDHYP